MNNMGLDPIHQFPDGLDSNGDAHKPEPETKNPAKVEGSEVGRSRTDHDLSSNSSVSISKSRKNGSNSVIVRRERHTRACTARPPKYVDPPAVKRRSRAPKKEKVEVVEEEGSTSGDEENEGKGKCSKVVTLLVKPPTIEQMPRWSLRSMWELASILNFFHVFRPLLNITFEFSADELESALLTPNDILGEVHIPLLKSIPPVVRMACGLDTWVTVLCRKLRDWWHWVAEGELPIVSSQGAEIEAYKNLDPAVRVVILKALCDIRVEQDDVRSYIDNSVKHGVQLSAFHKPRIGGDSHGISYWYEDDELIGHRLYRDIRKVETIVEPKKGKIKGSHVLSSATYEWETVATNLDEFLGVSEKLFASKNRTEVSLGKKLKNDLLPEIEKIHKRKEQVLKKQQRQALLLDSYVTMDGLGVGRSRRDRKPVTYTSDDFDRSINDALEVTKVKQIFPEPGVRQEVTKSESFANGRWNGSSHDSTPVSFSRLSPAEYDEMDEDHKSGPDRSSRRRQKPQRYSENDFVGAVSDEEYVSDDDIVGEAVYLGETDLKQRKRKRKVTSSSEGEGDDEYHWSDENEEDDLEEEDDSEEDSISGSEDSDQPSGRTNKREGRARRGTVLQSDLSLRRSKRSTRTQIDYQQFEYSESETESVKRRTNPSEMGTRDSDEGNVEEHQEDHFGQSQDSDESNEEKPRERGFDRTSPSPSQDELDDVGGERRFLDLNELAPGSGFDDGPSA